jgi:hypothetical protein
LHHEVVEPRDHLLGVGAHTVAPRTLPLQPVQIGAYASKLTIELRHLGSSFALGTAARYPQECLSALPISVAKAAAPKKRQEN